MTSRGPVGAGRQPLTPPYARAVVRQLRIYEIFDDTRDAFLDRFRDHAARIMARHGFRILAAWESSLDGRLEFVYLLEWPDEETMRAQWAAFLADEEWQAIKRETAARHGTLVGDIEDRVLRPVAGFPHV